jgi:hypothetical protein
LALESVAEVFKKLLASVFQTSTTTLFTVSSFPIGFCILPMTHRFSEGQSEFITQTLSFLLSSRLKVEVKIPHMSEK